MFHSPNLAVAWLPGPGKVTLLTSQWKSGKSTLVSLLLARMQQGGQLAGLPVSAGKAFVVSEECEADWRVRFQNLGVRENVHLLCRPFTTPFPARLLDRGPRDLLCVGR